MPESIAPIQLPAYDFSSGPLRFIDNSIDDTEALTLVNQTFNTYETWRTQNIDWRWRVHDQLYCGLVPQKVWEGTGVARSSQALPYVFQQVETAMPQIMEALFGFDDWFSVTPEPGGGLAEARSIQAHLKYCLEHTKNDWGQPASAEFENPVRQGLIYGNGAIMVEWDAVMKRPVPLAIDIRDVYIDPACPSPNVDEARSLVYRRLMTVEDVDNLRKDPRMKIPPKSVLVFLSETVPGVMADNTKRNSEAARKQNFTPGFSDWIPWPAGKWIEVLIYYDKGRIIWVLNRQVVIFNDANPFGFIPFCIAPCWQFPFRFYGIGFGDQLEGPQNTAQALLNAHLDELTLAIYPPRYIKRNGGITNISRTRLRPGLTIETQGDPNKEVYTQQTQQATKDAFNSIGFIRQIAEEVSGVNAMAQGIPRPGNVNRTATGVQSQLQGSTNRLQLIVRHYEDYLIGPMLYKMYKMIQLNSNPGDLLPALGPNEQFMTVGAEAFHSPIRFKMNASSRMMNRDKLMQSLPILEQALFQPQVMQNLNSMGYTVDPLEFMIMLQDATGTTRAYNLVRPLTDQEQQQRNQPPPELQMQMQQAQMDQQTRMQLGQLKSQTELQSKQMQHDWETHGTDEKSASEILKLISADKAELMNNNPQQKQQELEQKRQEAQMKLQHQQQKHQMDLQQSQQKHQMDMRQMQQKAVVDSISNRLQLQNDNQKNNNDLQNQQLMNHNKMNMQNQQHIQALAIGQQKHKQQMKQAEQKASLQTKQK